MSETLDRYVEVISAKQGQPGAMRIQDLLNKTIATKATLRSPANNDIPVPDGTLQNHIQRRLQELGGMSAYVILRIVDKTPLSPPIEVPIPERPDNKPYSDEELFELAKKAAKEKGVPFGSIRIATNQTDKK